MEAQGSDSYPDFFGSFPEYLSSYVVLFVFCFSTGKAMLAINKGLQRSVFFSLLPLRSLPIFVHFSSIDSCFCVALFFSPFHTRSALKISYGNDHPFNLNYIALRNLLIIIDLQHSFAILGTFLSAMLHMKFLKTFSFSSLLVTRCSIFSYLISRCLSFRLLSPEALFYQLLQSISSQRFPRECESIRVYSSNSY